MLKDEDIKLLKWFFNRLIYKYRFTTDNIVCKKIYEIIVRLQQPFKVSINETDLDSIITKYYADFNLEKCERMGYTDQERQQLRQTVIKLTEDIYNFSQIGQKYVTSN